MKKIIPMAFALVALCCATGCASQVSLYRKPPLRPASANDLTLEQSELIRLYGDPTRVSHLPYGVTRWVYCRGESTVLLVEFDCNNQLLGQWQHPLENCSIELESITEHP